MNRISAYFTAVLLLALSLASGVADARSAAAGHGTLRSQMEVIHETFGVNFVYDSSLDLDVPCKGLSTRPDRGSLEESLRTLFAGTGIEYEIMKKYIVLTRAGSKKKPKNYTIFIEEQHDTHPASMETAITAVRRTAKNFFFIFFSSL